MRHVSKLASWPEALGLALFLMGVPALAETRFLSIAVSRTDGAELPPDAVLEVDLLDVSRADAPSTRVASQRLRVDAWPASIRLPYESEAIDARMTYVVAARVVSDGTVHLRTTTAYPVLTRNAPESVAIELVKAGGLTSPPSPGQRITGVPWAVTEIGGRALIADDPPTIAFLDDGTFSMFGGCNRFRGRARLSGGRIEFVEPIAGTMKACLPPRTQLESSLLAALMSTVGYKRNGTLLSFANDAGAVVVRFREEPE